MTGGRREGLAEHAVGRFYEQLNEPGRPNLVFLVGASGSGKSSLLRAGIGPRLTDAGLRVRHLAPGREPARVLEEALRATAQNGEADAYDTARLVLLIDQFEEVFTECDDPLEQVGFLQYLEALVASETAESCAAVLTLRSDFYADLVATGHLRASLENAQVLVGPMSREEVRRAIVEPARLDGTSVDADLVELMLRDFIPSGALGTQHDVGALPLLSHALLETWKRSRRGRMTVADYHAAGGLTGAIERSAELAYQRCDDVERELVRQVFLRLVHLEKADVATRRTVSFTELDGLLIPVEPAGEQGRSREVRQHLSGFVEARLVTASAATVEISHETLLEAWPRLRRWIDEARDALRVQRRITDATQLWLANLGRRARGGRRCRGDPITGPTGRIFDLDTSPDGAMLAGAVADGSAWLWDITNTASPHVQAVLGSGTSPLYTTTFAPSGDTLAASGADMLVRMWQLDEAAAIAALCGSIGDPLTEEEWALYFTDRPYEPPCHA